MEQLRWTRISIGNAGVNPEGQVPRGIDTKGHTHAFYRDGNDKRVIDVEVCCSIYMYLLDSLYNKSKVDATAGKDRMVGRLTAGVKDLLGTFLWFHFRQIIAYPYPVLKSTGSAFTSFIRDEYTTLVEVDDRIFSTAIDLSYTFAPFGIPAPMDEKKPDFRVPADVNPQGGVWDAEVAERARNAMMNAFADDESASVQVSSGSPCNNLTANSRICRQHYTKWRSSSLHRIKASRALLARCQTSIMSLSICVTWA